MNKPIYLLILCISVFSAVKSQEVDLDKLLDERDSSKKKASELVIGTFKTTRVVNGASIENTQKGILDLRISHRFGRLNQGSYDLFGLDNATMRMGVDYGVSDRLMIGIGRSTFQKQYDGFFKYRILRQSEGKVVMPVSLSWLSSAALKTLTEEDPQPGVKHNSSDKWSFAHQVIIARKFSERFSLQLMPSMVHYNIVPVSDMKNDFFSVGMGGRLKITQKLSLNAEFYPQINQLPGSQNSLSVGVDIETGGHVFQLHFTNSTGIIEQAFLAGTDGTWDNGDIHFGFNISRVFTVKKYKS